METPRRRKRDYKKFHDFAKEFFMIFLAVTLGFLAENFREHLTEENHVSVLVQQLKEDLTTDTINIVRLIGDQEIQIRRTDSLFDALTAPDKDLRTIQQLLIRCDHIELFYPSAGAAATIKLESNLKRFVQTRISTHITNYERNLALLQEFERRDVDYMGAYLESFMSKHFTPANAHAASNRLLLPEERFRNISPADYEQMAVDITLIKVYNKQLVIHYKSILSDAGSFIAFIDATY